MDDDWGPNGKPTISDMIGMLSNSHVTDDAAAWLMTLANELEDMTSTTRAAFASAHGDRGFSAVLSAIEDFGFGGSNQPEPATIDGKDAVTSDVVATLGCGLLFLATASFSRADMLEAAKYKQAAVEAGAFTTLVDLLRAWPQNVDVIDATMHAIDSLTEGGAPDAQGRKLAALECQALPAVLDALNAHKDELQVQEYGLGTLARLVGLDEAHRQQLADAGDEQSVMKEAAVSQLPREIGFQGGAIELARNALRLHAVEDPNIAVHAITVLANLAMGSDAGAPARKEAARAALPEVRAAVQANPAVKRAASHLIMNLSATFKGPNEQDPEVTRAHHLLHRETHTQLDASGNVDLVHKGDNVVYDAEKGVAANKPKSTISFTVVPSFINSNFTSKVEYDKWVSSMNGEEITAGGSVAVVV